MALIKCKECGKEVSSRAKSCPSCGVKVKGRFSVIKFIGGAFLLFLLGSFLIGVMEGAGSGGNSSGRGSTAVAKEAASPLQASDVSFGVGQFGARVIKGSVTNTTGRKLGYVQVEINLFDGKGAQVGSTLANVNNLEPGTTWNFEAPVLEDRAKSAKVAGITSF